MVNPSSSASAAPARELRHGFRVVGLNLVPAAAVLTEVVAQAEVFAVPKAGPALLGMMNLRGSFVPLFDPQRLAHAPGDVAPTRASVLVFGRDDDRIGLRLDQTPELMQLALLRESPAKPLSVLSPFLTQAWAMPSQPGQVWWELDHLGAFEFLARHTPQASDTLPTFASTALDSL